MTVRIAHSKVSPVPDGDNTDWVRPSDWNADHLIEGLGTAAEVDSSEFATAEQGALAESAVQPSNLGALATKDAVVVSDIDATGAPSSTTYLRGDGAWSTPAAGEPIIIYATGQSNLAQRPAFSWTPEPNSFEWNAEASGSTGTAFIAMPDSEINVAQRFTSEVARANPGRNVYLIRMGGSGQPIAQWMIGAGAPDMFAIGKANVEAALTVLGKDKIDLLMWWQGESDAASPGSYEANFETVIDRFKGEMWFPEATPIIVMGIASEAISGDPDYRDMNSYLQRCVNKDPERRMFFYTPGAVPAADWADTLHLADTGHNIAGFALANSWLNSQHRAVIPGMTVDPENITYSFGDGIPVTTAVARWVRSQNATTRHDLAVNNDSGNNADARAVVTSAQGNMQLRAYGASLTGSGALSWSGSGAFYIQATHASGILRFSAGGLTERMTILANGNTGINESAPDYKLDVNGSFGFTPGASVTPADNGDVVFELTNNTTLTVKAKGGDGTVRSATLTLS